MPTLRARASEEVGVRIPSRAGPVMLATLEVPFDPEAAELAVDSAVESGQPLLCVNVVEIPLGHMAAYLGFGDLDDPPEDAARLRAPAELAQSLGVEVERLRVRTPHPVAALIELATEREPGLLVFGPDRERLRGRRYRKAARAVREQAPCLVWLPA